MTEELHCNRSFSEKCLKHVWEVLTKQMNIDLVKVELYAAEGSSF